MAHPTLNMPDKLLFEEVPCYISLHNLEGKILKTNRKFREMFGERLGDYCYEVLKHRQTKCVICPMDRIINHLEPFHHEEVVFSPEGDPINVLVNTAPITDENGNLIAIMEIATDITETKLLQRKFEESRERYRLLYNEVPCFISVQDKNFRIIDSNRRFKDEFGGRHGEFCYEIYKHRNSRCDVCPVAETFEDGNIHHSEEIIKSKSGFPMNILVLAAPLHDSQGNVHSVMEMLTDITHIRRMQTQMESVGQLVSSLAHTIKGIITGLEGGMYVVESGFSRNKEDVIRKGWDMVQRNIERVSHLVLDMLYYAKARDPEYTKIDFNKLCNDIFELFSKKFKDNNINAKFDVAADVSYKGDSRAIYTLLLTLVENAIDACCWDSSKVSNNISVSIINADSSIVITVEDDGLGIDNESLTKLFTTMYTTKGSGGSGFGLMLVKKIVDEHRGKIEVESEKDKGAKFKISLPKS